MLAKTKVRHKLTVVPTSQTMRHLPQQNRETYCIKVLRVAYAKGQASIRSDRIELDTHIPTASAQLNGVVSMTVAPGGGP